VLLALHCKIFFLTLSHTNQREMALNLARPLRRAINDPEVELKDRLIVILVFIA